MSPADRPPVCIAVRNSVQATWTYLRPPAARAGVSSAYSTPAWRSSSRTWSMNGSHRAAALPRTPAMNPAETCAPARSPSSRAARPTGRWCAQARFAACACTSGPYCARPVTPGGACPAVTTPHRPQARACTWYSVTTGGGGGAMSNTCSLCTAATAALPRSAPHPEHAAESTPLSRLRQEPGAASMTARPAACRACGRRAGAATGPSASSGTGCPTTAAGTSSTSPFPAAAPAPQPAPPAPPPAPRGPRSERPWRPASRPWPRRPRATARSRRAARPAHQAQRAHPAQPVLDQSRRSVINATRPAGSP